MTKKIRVNLRKSVDKTKQSKKMNRRESLKNMTLSAFGLAAFPSGAIEAENIGDKKIKVPNGRLESEAVRDAKLNAEKFFTPDELKTVTVLSDIILPADATSGSASQVGVPAFIEFMMKDQPQYQTQMRGGLMWLNNQTNKRFQKPFIACSQAQQLQVVDDIAYPEQLKPGMQQGAAFFTLIRSFVMTGFYTTEVGFKDLGYVGNRPNNWEGVPEEVLKQYGVAYD
jgi:gluconate 2-dehydrogenase gamma chain